MIETIVDGITFNDILIAPQYSEVHSRKDIDTSSRLAGDLIIRNPILSANMDTVTELDMANAMSRLGGVGVIHRFLTPEAQSEMLRQVNGFKIVTIGVKQEDIRRLELVSDIADAVLIDIAHGHSKRVIDLIKDLKAYFPGIPVIAGNVASYDGALALIDAGADSIKVGVGPGSVCTTRIVTGCGVPQVTAIMEARRAVQDFYRFTKGQQPTIIGDGGLKAPGDVFKALTAGADTVMIGGMFAGTDESPGDTICNAEGKSFKLYRGMASSSAQQSIGVTRTAEGVETGVACKGSVEAIFNEIMDGVRSGMSYVGCATMEGLRTKPIRAIKMSRAGLDESRPHGLDVNIT